MVVVKLTNKIYDQLPQADVQVGVWGAILKTDPVVNWKDQMDDQLPEGCIPGSSVEHQLEELEKETNFSSSLVK